MIFIYPLALSAKHQFDNLAATSDTRGDRGICQSLLSKRTHALKLPLCDAMPVVRLHLDLRFLRSKWRPVDATQTA